MLRAAVAVEHAQQGLARPEPHHRRLHQEAAVVHRARPPARDGKERRAGRLAQDGGVLELVTARLAALVVNGHQPAPVQPNDQRLPPPAPEIRIERLDRAEALACVGATRDPHRAEALLVRHRIGRRAQLVALLAPAGLLYAEYEQLVRRAEEHRILPTKAGDARDAWARGGASAEGLPRRRVRRGQQGQARARVLPAFAIAGEPSQRQAARGQLREAGAVVGGGLALRHLGGAGRWDHVGVLAHRVRLADPHHPVELLRGRGRRGRGRGRWGAAPPPA